MIARNVLLLLVAAFFAVSVLLIYNAYYRPHHKQPDAQ
jgi:hypothetical protein